MKTNYRLYRSNVKLGGQLKWDITLDGSSGNVYVSKLGLSPISSNMCSTFDSSNIFNYSHLENMKMYYQQNEDNFYVDGVDPKLCISNAIVCDNVDLVNTYWDQFDCGVKRISYNDTNKQFQFFCPLWLEDFKDSDQIKVTFVVKSGADDDFCKEKSFILNNTSTDYNKKFTNYLSNYIKNIYKDDEIGEELICCDLINKKSSIYGINVQSGQTELKDTTFCFDDLLGLIRPKMEFDYLLLNQLERNKIIARQLFNLSFLFNYEDLLSVADMNLLSYGAELNVDCKISIIRDNVESELKLVDFASKYEEDTCINNVKYDFNYLKDYSCIDLVDKNKLCPNIFHWGLQDSTNYSFNMYPYISYNINVDTKDICFDESSQKWVGCFDGSSHKWMNGDWSLKENDSFVNDNGSSYFDLSDDMSTLTIDQHYRNICKIYQLPQLFSDFSARANTQIYVNTLFYDIPQVRNTKLHFFQYNIGDISGNWDNIYADILNKKFKNQWVKINVGYKDNPIWIVFIDIDRPFSTWKDTNDEHIIVLYDNQALMMFNCFRTFVIGWINNTLNDNSDYYIDDCNGDNCENFKTLITCFTNILSCVKHPSQITFRSSYVYKHTNGPVQVEGGVVETKEIEYYNDDISPISVYRYGGYIKPIFIDSPTQRWMIKKITPNEFEINWDKFIKSGYKPLYPSIDYFYLVEATKNNHKFEEHWMNEGYNYKLKDTLSFSVKNFDDLGNVIELDFDDLIDEYLSSYYKVEGDELEYIRSLYDINKDFEYASLTSTNLYIYTITMTLK